MGTFLQAMWSILDGKCLYISATDSLNLTPHTFFGHHFSPILLLFAGIYAIFRTPLALLILISIMVGIAALPLYSIGIKTTKSKVVAFSFALAYLLNPLIHDGTVQNMHIIEAVQPLLIFSLLLSILGKNYRRYFILLILYLACKENVSIVAIFLGIYIWLGLHNRKAAFTTILIALGWGIVAIATIHFTGKNIGEYASYFTRYGMIGDTPRAFITTLLLNPVKVIQVITSHIEGLVRISLPTGIFPLFSGWAILLILPNTLQGLLSNIWPMYLFTSYYAMDTLPYYFYSGLVGIAFLRRIGMKKNTMTTESTSKRVSKIICVVSSIWILTGTVYLLFTPRYSNYKIFSPANWKMGIWEGQWAKTIKSVPSKKIVSSDLLLYSYLYDRLEWGCFPITSKGDYIVACPFGNWYFWERERYLRHLMQILKEGKYGVKEYDAGLIILEKGYSMVKNEKVAGEIFGNFEGESLHGKIGRNIADLEAYNKASRYGNTAAGSNSLVYGPYIPLPPGDYSVQFRIKTTRNAPNNAIAILDVCGHSGQKIYSQRDITGDDFKTSGKYEIFTLYFHLKEKDNLEWRVYFTGLADVWVDKIQLFAPHLNMDDMCEIVNSFNHRFYQKKFDEIEL